MATSTNSPHLFLIGSTGRTGRAIIEEALKRGHHVTALARDPASLSSFTAQQGLSIVKGSPTSESDLSSAFDSALEHASGRQIIIISTLGQTRKSGNPWAAVTSPPMFMTKAAETLLSVVSSLPSQAQSKIEKLVIMSMFGAGDSFENLHRAIKPVMRYSNMQQTVEDHSALDKLIRSQNQLKYLMVRPSMLKEGDPLPVKVHGQDGQGEGWLPSSVTVGTVVTSYWMLL